MTDIAPLVGRSLSEPEWADFEAVVAQWTSKLAEDAKRPPPKCNILVEEEAK